VNPTLSILIPTVVKPGAPSDRQALLARLMARLTPQITDRVVVLTEPDAGLLTIGRKRQMLLDRATTDFVAYVDDDDLVHERYVDLVLDAIDQGADVVGFKLRYYEEGALNGYACHSVVNTSWDHETHADGLRRFSRPPNHLNPVRIEMARAIGFQSRNMGEDAEYSTGLREKFPEMHEVFVDEFLYDYFYRFKKPDPIVMYEPDGRLTREGMEVRIREGGSVMFRGRMCSTIEQLDEC
jgi:glycosyltransferase involved in cell wall biosynthesis